MYVGSSLEGNLQKLVNSIVVEKGLKKTETVKVASSKSSFTHGDFTAGLKRKKALSEEYRKFMLESKSREQARAPFLTKDHLHQIIRLLDTLDGGGKSVSSGKSEKETIELLQSQVMVDPEIIQEIYQMHFSKKSQ